MSSLLRSARGDACVAALGTSGGGDRRGTRAISVRRRSSRCAATGALAGGVVVVRPVVSAGVGGRPGGGAPSRDGERNGRILQRDDGACPDHPARRNGLRVRVGRLAGS